MSPLEQFTRSASHPYACGRKQEGSLHAVAQLHQGLVEGVDSDKPQTRIFDIENQR
ncbi:MAG: hypothetical protein K0Q64_964 [Nitrobacter vulgaris]|jgi:hypothetical protein|nr:hypothetical protein [Nitrobacter vulgaris]